MTARWRHGSLDVDDRAALTDLPRGLLVDDGPVAGRLADRVHDDVDSSECLGCLGEQALDVDVIGDVAPDRRCDPVRGEDFVDDPIRGDGVAGVAQHHRITATRGARG